MQVCSNYVLSTCSCDRLLKGKAKGSEAVEGVKEEGLDGEEVEVEEVMGEEGAVGLVMLSSGVSVGAEILAGSSTDVAQDVAPAVVYKGPQAVLNLSQFQGPEANKRKYEARP